MTARGLVKAIGVALIYFASQGAEARIVGKSTESGDVVRLQMQPDRDLASQRASLFIGILQLQNGAPNIAVAGWYDGRDWKASGMPLAAFTGNIPAQVATVRVPGGVCSQVRAAGGPAGTYAMYAGWGRTTTVSSNLDEAEIRELIKTSDPEMAQQLQRLMGEYRAALDRSMQYGDTASMAFTDMRTRNTFWEIKQFDCGGV